jgi:UDP-N-acetylmuramoyl-L-alanyl-D-glutamate--2,6-diaminopimelate ligase
MGEISGKLSDLSVITDDNPRFEEPLEIIEDIKKGINKTRGKYIVISGRKEAIAYCISHAKKGDIIVLAGKGHEDYQDIKGVKYPFDERTVIFDIVKNMRQN